MAGDDKKRDKGVAGARRVFLGFWWLALEAKRHCPVKYYKLPCFGFVV